MWMSEWLADGEINWYIDDWWSWVARWGERLVNICASWRAEGWVRFSVCMNRSGRGSGVNGKRMVKRINKKEEGEGALQVLRWLKGPEICFLDKSWFYYEPEETGNSIIGIYHYLSILIFKEHDLVYQVTNLCSIFCEGDRVLKGQDWPLSA